MKVTLVAAANKYTGAAAAAEHFCRALHAAGVEATLLFVGGNNLERRLADFAWARPALRKERSAADLRSNMETLRQAAVESTVLVTHLPHDHFLCVTARVHRVTPLVRNFRNGGHLRRDPLHRMLDARLAAALAAHSSMLPAVEGLLPGNRPAAALPVPLEERFRPRGDGPSWRRALEIPAGAPVVGMVGKMAPGRGFDLALRTAALLGEEAHVIAIGHGEARPSLEALASRLRLAGRIRWTGYRERELPGLYEAMDVVLYPAVGSDHGHRAVSEAQGCGRPVVAGGFPGVADLIDDGSTGRITDPADGEGVPVRLVGGDEVRPFVERVYRHRTFFSRLHHFVRLSSAFVVFPGGIGSILEAMMIWQLLQVHHLPPVPFVLYGHHWDGLLEWMEATVVGGGYADPGDLSIPLRVDRVDDAMEIITSELERFHRSREPLVP